jgi:hypothetical protein
MMHNNHIITFNDTTNLLSNETIENVRKNIIEPEIVKNVTQLVSAPRYWRKSANLAQTLSQIFVGINIILSFCSTGLNMPILSIIAGVIGTIAIVLSQFASFSEKEGKESNAELNILLAKVLHLESLPDLITTDGDKKDEDIERADTTNINKSTHNIPMIPIINSGISVSNK